MQVLFPRFAAPEVAASWSKKMMKIEMFCRNLAQRFKRHVVCPVRQHLIDSGTSGAGFAKLHENFLVIWKLSFDHLSGLTKILLPQIDSSLKIQASLILWLSLTVDHWRSWEVVEATFSQFRHPSCLKPCQSEVRPPFLARVGEGTFTCSSDHALASGTFCAGGRRIIAKFCRTVTLWCHC